MVIVGGAKVADKLGVLTEMMKIADKVIVGGRMAYTFLAQQGVALGSTHVEHELADSAKEIMQLAEANVRTDLFWGARYSWSFLLQQYSQQTVQQYHELVTDSVLVPMD